MLTLGVADPPSSFNLIPGFPHWSATAPAPAAYFAYVVLQTLLTLMFSATIVVAMDV